jgi:hypothetical protein
LQIDRSEIEASLAAKGFIKEDSHHRYFYHEVEGKRSGVFTYTSHGSHYKTIGDNLLKQMKKQLRLDTSAQIADLFKCPMTGDGYNELLRKKGML